MNSLWPQLGVVAHDVPEDRLAADLDHRLRDAAASPRPSGRRGPPQKITTFIASRPSEPASSHAAISTTSTGQRVRRQARRKPGSISARSGSGRRASHPRRRCRRAGREISSIRFQGRIDDHVGPRLGDPLRRIDRDVRARREPAVLVRVAVDRVVEEVGADAAVVEERVPLARGAVADDLLPGPPQPDQQLEQRPLRLLRRPRRSAVALGLAQARRPPRARGARRRPSVGARPSRRVGRVDAERAAVARAAPRRRRPRARAPRRASRSLYEREVREVLVVDRVVLEALEQPGEVGELERRGPARGEQDRDAARRSRSGRVPARARCCR